MHELKEVVKEFLRMFDFDKLTSEEKLLYLDNVSKMNKLNAKKELANELSKMTNLPVKIQGQRVFDRKPSKRWEKHKTVTKLQHQIDATNDHIERVKNQKNIDVLKHLKIQLRITKGEF